ncbi:MAG: T9SS type A sorting domain-containing protein, partial [Candidatus Cloacimonadota bacterium]|nr:T9SS type A sorting domain-containing protein [Candidatus Cloacimonadota bacterium]
NVSFDLEIENITSTDAEMVEVEISTENEFLTIINSVEEIEIINGLSSVTLTDVFEIAVSEIIPDGTEIEINIEIYTGEIAFYESFVSVAQAPQIVINSVSLLDNEGNNNGTIDANENFTLELGIKNIGHYSAEEISVSYNSITNLISLLSEEDVFCGEIQPDSLNSISYDFYATDDIEIGDQINFQFLLSWGAYQDFNSIHTISGASVESFESGYNSFDWNFEDNITWQISTTESVDGNLSSYSRDIDDNEITSMWLTTNTMGAQPVSFYYKVSSEATYDFFNFYIDEQLQNSWSGEIEWEFVQFEVPAGEHILKWEYTKDGMVSEGEDKVWIDMITLPTMIEISENENDVIIPKISQINKIYPNPFNPKTTILFSNSQTENVRIDVFNIRGQLVNKLINQQFTKGNHSIVWDGEDDSSNEVSSGVYFVRFKSDSNVSLNKIMLLK